MKDDVDQQGCRCMWRKYRALFASIAVVAAIAVAAVVTRSHRGAEPEAQAERASPQAPTTAAGGVSPGASTTSPPTTIAATMRRPLGPKAYQIARTGDVRPVGDALAHVEALLSRSRSGDASATHEIYLTVLQCKTFMSDEADDLAASATAIGAGAAFLNKSERLLNECASLAATPSLYGTDWLATAAEQGSAEAMLIYSSYPNEAVGTYDDLIAHPEKADAWKGRAVSYLDALVRDGNIDAVAELARAYGNGGAVERDPVAAYAYNLAAQRVDPAFVAAPVMRSLEGELSAAQRTTAARMAGRIYGSCCVR